jgi:aldose 1-epimerase
VVAPSGQQYEIAYAEQQAVIVSVGGGIRTYSVSGRPVLDGYAKDAMCDAGRGQTLAPWPNRVRDGRWSWRGRDFQLALTEPAQHNAIHGLVRWMPWALVSRDDSSITLSCTTYPQPGYPWVLEITNAWSLGAEGVAVSTTVANRSETAAPVAVGFHPYVVVGTEGIDSALLTLPAESRFVTGSQQIPSGREPVAGSDYDFRDARAIGPLSLDHCYGDLRRDADGRCRVRLSAADGGQTVTLWVDASYPYIEAFTGDTVGDPSRRRRSLAIEPMSAPPNALATGEGVVALEPGQRWHGQWGINPFEHGNGDGG